ncbi:copper homeostasis membrane protein CopD [Bordetella muralis]|uniref:copper homeostasis membrane protein CopD n=1 Tax=Bordetella muralis TaxID=1649130 RepID=UPI0039EE9AFF
MVDDWLNIALRVALYVDMAALFGVALFGVYALHTNERMSGIAQRYIVFGRVTAFVGMVLSLCLMAVMAKAMSGAQDYGELSAHVFEMILTGTHMGQAWSVRIVALGVCILMTVLKLNPRLRFLGLAGASGIALSTLAWAGHGAMDDGIRGYIHLSTDIAHLWAAGAWVGALAAFLMLAVTRKVSVRGSVEILSRTSTGFASIGTLIVATLIVTGIVNYLLIVGPSLAPLFTTLYGRLLLGKLTLFVGMLCLAAANRYRLSPKLELSLTTGNSSQAAAILRKSLLMESMLAICVLASVAWLGVLSPVAV